VADSEIALPLRIAAISLGQPLCQHVADLVISNRQVSLIGPVRLLRSKPGEQTMGFIRAGKLLAGVSKDFVIARELDQRADPRAVCGNLGVDWSVVSVIPRWLRYMK
jgi:hypothetical protein